MTRGVVMSLVLTLMTVMTLTRYISLFEKSNNSYQQFLEGVSEPVG